MSTSAADDEMSCSSCASDSEAVAAQVSSEVETADTVPGEDSPSSMSVVTSPPSPPPPITPRAYQLEMLEESLKQNIIVAVRRVADCEGDNADMLVERWTQGAARHRCK